MTAADTCILVACLLPLLCTGLAKYKGFTKPRAAGGYDNHNPRQWLATLGGAEARANAAQQNSFEALPIFIAGVLIAELHSGAQARIDLLAMIFIAVRLGYIAAYVADQATIRTLLWGVGFALSVSLFFVA